HAPRRVRPGAGSVREGPRHRPVVRAGEDQPSEGGGAGRDREGRKLVKLLLLSSALLLLAADTDSYRAEIDRWRARRVEGLKREDSWLTVAGLFWLEPGENGVGSGAGNRVALPAGKAPERSGALVVSGGAVTAKLDPAAGFTSGGNPV